MAGAVHRIDGPEGNRVSLSATGRGRSAAAVCHRHGGCGGAPRRRQTAAMVGRPRLRHRLIARQLSRSQGRAMRIACVIRLVECELRASSRLASSETDTGTHTMVFPSPSPISTISKQHCVTSFHKVRSTCFTTIQSQPTSRQSFHRVIQSFHRVARKTDARAQLKERTTMPKQGSVSRRSHYERITWLIVSL